MNDSAAERLEAVLRASHEAKLATLRPEIQLLNRLLAAGAAGGSQARTQVGGRWPPFFFSRGGCRRGSVCRMGGKECCVLEVKQALVFCTCRLPGFACDKRPVFRCLHASDLVSGVWCLVWIWNTTVPCCLAG